jgi:hypothetical protein
MNTTHKDKNILKKIEDGITSAIIIIFVLAIIAAGSGMIALPLYLFFKWGNYGKKAVPLEIKIKLSKTISIFSIIICLLIYYFIELPSLLNLLPQNDSELFIGISAVGALCYGVLYKIVKIDETVETNRKQVILLLFTLSIFYLPTVFILYSTVSKYSKPYNEQQLEMACNCLNDYESDIAYDDLGVTQKQFRDTCNKIFERKPWETDWDDEKKEFISTSKMREACEEYKKE